MVLYAAIESPSTKKEDDIAMDEKNKSNQEDENSPGQNNLDGISPQIERTWRS